MILIYDLDIHLSVRSILSVYSVIVESNMCGQDHQNAAEDEHNDENIGIVALVPIVHSYDTDDGEMERAMLDIPTEDKKNN